MQKFKPFIFYLTLFILILIFSFNAAGFDFDLWARLIAGMGVIDGGHVLKSDFLSYTPVHVWFDHEWGSGVIFYFFLKYFGPYSLIILQSLLIFLIFFIVSLTVKVRTKCSPYCLLLYFVALMAVMPNLNNPIRCHLFSFLFFALYIYILERVRRGQNGLLFILPVITIFWNNVHGGIVSGIGLMVIYAAGEFLNCKQWLKYLTTCAACCLVMLINPWGYEYIKFLLRANTMNRPDIIEWWGIFSKFHLFKQIPFKLFLLTVLLNEAVCLKNSLKLSSLKTVYEKCDKVKIILLAVTLYLSVVHVKLIPLFVISALIFCYEDFCSVFGKIKSEFCEKIEKTIYILLITLCVFSVCVKQFSIPISESVYPVKEVEFIKLNNIHGNLIVNFGLGSYVSYKLYPDNLIFMDGRYEEVYYDEMMPLLKKFYLVKPDWDEILVKFPPECIILEKYYPIYNVLRHSKDWTEVYTSKVFSVFIPSENRKKTYVQPSDDKNYYKNTLFDTGIKFNK